MHVDGSEIETEFSYLEVFQKYLPQLFSYKRSSCTSGMYFWVYHFIAIVVSKNFKVVTSKRKSNLRTVLLCN